MLIKKIFTKRIGHSMGFALVGLAMLENLVVFVPKLSLVLFHNNEKILMCLELIFVPITALFLILYLSQLFSAKWFSKWQFTCGYLFGLLVSILLLILSFFFHKLLVNLFEIFPFKFLLQGVTSVINFQGDYYGILGLLVLQMIGVSFILFVFLPVLFGILSLFTRKSPRPE
jgi:hypothetical protein